MNIKIQHSFQTKAHNLVKLFEGKKKLSQFLNELNIQSQIDPNRYDINKYLGDGFEFFIELFLKLHPCDNRVGVYNYQPTQENDNGVDGVGVNIKNEKSVVQIKYRTNKDYELTANNDHLSNMFTDGQLTHGVIADLKSPNNYHHFVFTTAKGLHFYTDNEMFKKSVKCYGYDDIKGLVDNNIIFWNTATEIVKQIVESNTQKKPVDVNNITGDSC